MQRTLGAGAVGGQGAVVADLTDWRGEKKERERHVRCEHDRKQVKESDLRSGGKMCPGIPSEIYQANKVCAEKLYSLPSVMS